MSESAPSIWNFLTALKPPIHGILAALGLAIVAAFRKAVVRHLQAFWHRVTERRRIGAENGEKLDRLLAEFKPNGGSSLRDAINRLELGQTELQCHIRINRANFTQPIFVTDKSGLCTEVNAAYVDLVGRPEAELLGFGWVVAIYIDDRAQVRDEWFSAVEDKRAFEMEYRMINSNGEIHDVLTHATPVTVRGEIFGHVGYVKVLGSHNPGGKKPPGKAPQVGPTDEQTFLFEWSKGAAVYETKEKK